MQILSNANEIEKKGQRVIHLELGEPLKKTPQPVLDEVKKNLNINLPGYTPSNGIPELRNAISKFYKQKGFNISNDNIFVTVGFWCIFIDLYRLL